MSKRLKFGNILVLVSLAAFELISYSSTRQGLMLLFGVPQWASLLAFSFVAVDFAGAGLLFFGEDKLREAYWQMFAGWMLTVLGDVGMAYLNIANAMSGRAEGHILVQNGVIPLQMFRVTIPLLLAGLLTLMEVGLVHSLNMIISELRGSGRTVIVKAKSKPALPKQRVTPDMLVDFRRNWRQ